MKRCSVCKRIKTLSFFHKDKYTKDGFSCRCKDCQHKRDKKRYMNNTEKEKERNRRYREKNKEKMKLYNKEYCHRPEVKKRKKEWETANPNNVKNYKL